MQVQSPDSVWLELRAVDDGTGHPETECLVLKIEDIISRVVPESSVSYKFLML